MTSLLNKTNRSFLGTRTVCYSLACLLIGISAIAYAGEGTVVKKGVTPSLANAKAIAIAQPLAFEVNQGQTDQSVKFLARAKGYAAFLTSNESIVRINGDAVLRTKLRNANQSPKIAGEDPQTGKSNYLLGSDRSKWITGIQHFGKVRAKDVYPGIDLVYSGNEKQIEYDFVVGPGRDPSQIRMSFDGANTVAINRDGDMELRTAGGVMLAHKPVLYQTIDGQRKPVNGNFVLLAKNEAGFQVGSYDTSKTLVIDPTITVNSGIGGTSNDEGFAVGVNGTQVVLTGRTQSVTNVVAPNNTPDKPNSGFPVLNPLSGLNQKSAGGSWDAFITKFTVDPVTGLASMVYSTYLGTTGDEAGEGVGVDSGGNAYIAGYTDSAALLAPTSPGPTAPFIGVYDAFIAKLNPSGSAIIANTYVGGPGTTQAFGLAIDPVTGNIVIGGVTNGLAVAPGGAQKTIGGGTTDGFVASFNPSTLALVASTYIGGSSYDQVNAVAAGPDGAIYAAGLTASGNSGGGGNFPTKAAINVGSVSGGQQTAFVAKYTSTSLSSQTYSSIFGAGGEDANGVAGDANGVAYVVGATKRPAFSTATQGITGTCGTTSPGGTLPAGTTYGTAIQWLAAPSCFTDPGQTQGYLLSLTTAGAINYLDLGPVTTNDPANAFGCNLNLIKNGGAIFLPGSACSGFVGTWNAVATDSDQQAYVVGQAGIGGTPPVSYQGNILRFTRTGTLNFNTGGPLTEVNNGVAVNNTVRQEFVVGTWQATGAGGLGYLVPNTAGTPPTIIAPDSIVNQGLTDVSFLGVQWNDILVSPSVVTLGPVAVGTTPAPSQTVLTTTFAGVPVSCTWTGPTNAAFTVAALASTGTYSITLSTANIGVFTGTVTFNCGGDNGSTTVSLTGTVTGQMTAAPSASLTATSVIGSGILKPYNTTQGDYTITVQVTTPASSIPYTVTEPAANRSNNWPVTCTLISLLSTTGTATTPPGSSFQFRINSNCANQLALGVYSEWIAISSTTAGLASTINLPFQLTILNGGVVGQNITDFFFGTSTTPQVSNFTVQAPAGGLTYALVFMAPQENITPLPAANASIITGARGPIPGTGSVTATVQITPLNPSTGTILPNGVYGFCYFVSSPQIPQNNYTNVVCSRVYVGTGLGFIAPAGTATTPPGTLNISVPVGFTRAFITQPFSNGTYPPQINVTGLANVNVSPYSVPLPTGSAIGAFTPALPAGAFALTANDGNPCTTYAEQAINSPYRGPSCRYTVTIDSTQLTAGVTYSGTVTFTGATGVTAVLAVNIAATQYPQLSWVNNNGVPLPSLTFSSTVGSNTTLCTNNNPSPFNNYVVATGGVVPVVQETISPMNSWLGLNGTQGTPGNLGNTAPSNFTLANPLSAPNFYFQNVCVTAANITKPGTYTGTVLASGGGVQTTPATLQIILIVSGTGVSDVGIFRGTPTPQYYWLLDANGNTLFDGAGPGLDIATAFGGLAGDIAITGDWSGSGTTKIGIYRSSTGLFILDYNDDGLMSGNLIDRYYQFMPVPVAGDIPVTGDWTGTGVTKIGIYRPSTGQWFLDTNGNGVYDAGDVVVNYGGVAGDIPVTGDWNGNGITKIGIFRYGYYWILDVNGNGIVDVGPGADVAFAYGSPTGGIVGGVPDVPVVGDWNGDGTTKVGVFRLGFFWVLDTNGDKVFTAGEQAFPFGGLAGDIPVVGKWRKP